MSDITFRRPTAWKSYAATDVGCVRPVNEDAVLSEPEKRLWAVADGMGGHEIGDVASKKLVEVLETVSPQATLSDYVDAVEDALLSVNQQLIEYAKVMFENQTMGTTIVCLVVKDNVGVCLWVGDSRLYRYRNNRLQQLSRDHSQVAEMVQMGLISEEEAEVHPHRNVITRAVGVEPELFVDLNVFSAQIGDTFMLCSDGLYNMLSSQEIEQGLSYRNTEQSVTALMNKALEYGAADNVSIIVVKGEPGKVG